MKTTEDSLQNDINYTFNVCKDVILFQNYVCWKFDFIQISFSSVWSLLGHS